MQYADDGCLAFHFGMTGQLRYYKTADEPDYTYVRFTFENGYHLAFVCPRTFARLRLIDAPEAFIDEQDLGPDALDDLDLTTFLDALDGRRGTIKGALMNQSILAGLGNIYADEVLYQAEIHPKATIPDLDDDALRTLHAQIRPVLKAAIDHDANPTDLPADRYLLPHRYGDERCPHCAPTSRPSRCRAARRTSAPAASRCPSSEATERLPAPDGISPYDLTES